LPDGYCISRPLDLKWLALGLSWRRLLRMRTKLAIWGAGGHALVVADIVRLGGEYDIVGFLDDLNPDRQGEELYGATILGGRERLDSLRTEGIRHLVLGFGNCAARLRLSALVRAKGFSLATAIHPGAIVATDASIGAGTVVVAGAVINPGSRIGENAIVNTSASVGHECLVDDGAHVGPGARLAGRVVVERAAWVGVGAIAIEGVRIGANSLVGAGAVVVNDIPEGVVAYGNPARVIRRAEVLD
jgi:UDP-N-acetylbacillosamine N-acetyltransferase